MVQASTPFPLPHPLAPPSPFAFLCQIVVPLDIEGLKNQELSILVLGILSLVSSGRRFSYALSYDEFEGPSQSYIEFPYSAFFFCLAGIVICIVTFLLVLDVLLDIQKEQTKLAPRLGLELPQVTPA